MCGRLCSRLIRVSSLKLPPAPRWPLEWGYARIQIYLDTLTPYHIISYPYPYPSVLFLPTGSESAKSIGTSRPRSRQPPRPCAGFPHQGYAEFRREFKIIPDIDAANVIATQVWIWLSSMSFECLFLLEYLLAKKQRHPKYPARH